MNILTDGFPCCVEIDGEEWELNTDYRVGLKILMAFEDETLTHYEKSEIMLRLLYKELPEDQEKALNLGIKFLDCGETGEGDGEDIGRLYSFTKDAKYIYSAIKQTHGVDLSVEDIHWWQFVYMFLDLSEDCFFSRIIYYRKQGRLGKLTKEEQEYAHKIKDILELPLSAAQQEINDDFMKRLRGGDHV